MQPRVCMKLKKRKAETIEWWCDDADLIIDDARMISECIVINCNKINNPNYWMDQQRWVVSPSIPALHAFHLCMHSISACIPALHAFQLCMHSSSACIPSSHAFHLCMHFSSACIPSSHAFHLCMHFSSACIPIFACIPPLHAFHLCMHSSSVCIPSLHAFQLCMHSQSCINPSHESIPTCLNNKNELTQRSINDINRCSKKQIAKKCKLL